MKIQELAGYIDLTLLKPDAVKQDFLKLLAGAKKYPFASICIPPSYASLAKSVLKDSVKICTVIGFPFGYQTKEAKIFETRNAINSGADEIDMVMNVSLFKSGDIKYVQDEIKEVVDASIGRVVKVIIEACCLTDEEKIAACEMVIKSGASFVKTSTGFRKYGATVEDVLLLSKTANNRIKVKASGGINNLDTALKMINAGASRLGTSSGVEIIEELIQKQMVDNNK